MIAVACSAAWALPFTDYGSGTTVEQGVGWRDWMINWGQGPWIWFDPLGGAILDPTVGGLFHIYDTGPAVISPDLVATVPVAGTLTLTAYDSAHPDVPVGTMVLEGTGQNVVDINASRAIRDEATGMFLVAFAPPEPKLTMTVQSQTGVFADIEQIDPWHFYLSGFFAGPLVEGMGLQDNIFAALGRQIPVIGGVGEFVLTGQYIPEPATGLLLGLGSLVLLRRKAR